MIYQLENVSKFFEARHETVCSIDGVTFGVHEGEQTALLGPSGAGKTTLFRLLNGTYAITSGSLLFAGANVGEMSVGELRAMRRRIGTIYQQHHLVPSLTVLENTLCGKLGQWSLLHSIRSLLRPTRAEIDQALAALEAVGVADKYRSRADELSGGQQQRLAIARVLMQSPDVILADEPIASLDPMLAESIIDLLFTLARDRKCTLIVTLHDVATALRYFPRIIGLREGRIAFDTPTAELTQCTIERLYSDNDTQKRLAGRGGNYLPGLSKIEAACGPGCAR